MEAMPALQEMCAVAISRVKCYKIMFPSNQSDLISDNKSLQVVEDFIRLLADYLMLTFCFKFMYKFTS